MKNSEKSRQVINNFILHITHCDNFDKELGYKENITFTPKLLYKMADSYIKEDHVDGEDNPEDHIPIKQPRTIDDLNEISNDIVAGLVLEGLIPDCQDTDDETEFQVQDVINEKLAKYFGLDYEKLQE